MAKIPTNKLTIYLMKEGRTPGNALKDYSKVQEELIAISENTIGTLYYGMSNVSEPSWLDSFFNAGFDNTYGGEPTEAETRQYKLFNASSRAILLVEASVRPGQNRLFAIPFGYGATLLDPMAYEDRFGLKVTLNVVDPNSLRRIDRKSISAVPKDTSEQLAQAGDTAEFGIDIEQDLVQAITGNTLDSSFGNTITGKDFLSVSVPVDLSNISEFLRSCYKKYLAVDYRSDFGWIDRISDVRNPELLQQLNECLLQEMTESQTNDVWMAVPELIDWSNVEFAFNARKGTPRKEDLSLPDFMDSLTDDDDGKYLTIEALFKENALGFSKANGEVIHRWPVYRCLFCETERDGNTYLLSNGKWYEIEEDFYEVINNNYRRLLTGSKKCKLPAYKRSLHKDEGGYNTKVGGRKGGRFCCMHGKNIPYSGGYNKIEFCDLLSRSNDIVHVKKDEKGSSELSHLFSQGLVAGELFVSANDYRVDLNNELPIGYKLPDPDVKPNASEYRIVYAIISEKPDPLEIPFFSKVTLKNAAYRLESHGYTVFVQKIARLD